VQRRVFAAVFLLACSGLCSAGTIAILPQSGGFQNHLYNYNGTLGWTFSLSTPLVVTDLGYYDAAGDGLSDSYPVGIWDGSGTLLTSATVLSGTSGTLMDGFRFVSITPITLGPGGYTIGAFANATSTDDFRFLVPNFTTISGLMFGANATSPSGGLIMPAPVGGTGAGYFGPDFLAATSTVPEPRSLYVLAAGLIALFLAQRRIRNRREGYRGLNDSPEG
jgi:hypothetical protein